MEIKLEELLSLVKSEKKEATTFLQKGKCYLVRTVTYAVAGTLKDFNDREFLFEKADWIADTGRFSDNLKSCEFSEVEPFHNDAVVNRSAFTDITEIKRTPHVQK